MDKLEIRVLRDKLVTEFNRQATEIQSDIEYFNERTESDDIFAYFGAKLTRLRETFIPQIDALDDILSEED